MTKGTRMWLSGILGVLVWSFIAGSALECAIEKFNNGSWWCVFYGLAVIGATTGVFDSVKLINTSHNQE